MSDDKNSAWNGLTRVWPSLKHKLLCHWHLKKNVRKRCMSYEKLGTQKPSEKSKRSRSKTTPETEDHNTFAEVCKLAMCSRQASGVLAVL